MLSAFAQRNDMLNAWVLISRDEYSVDYLTVVPVAIVSAEIALAAISLKQFFKCDALVFCSLCFPLLSVCVVFPVVVVILFATFGGTELSVIAGYKQPPTLLAYLKL